MTAPRRMGRVNQLILEEIAVVVQQELSDPDIGFVTLTSVDTAPDLSTAKIYVSVLGDAERQKKTEKALNHAAAFVRAQIMPRLGLRAVPRLHFYIDHTAETAARISDLLRNPPPAMGPDEEKA
jgi:ribosome-binding factor A